MDSINIEGTPKTPTVKFDDHSGVLVIRGRSIPENSIDFYKPLIDWLDAYADGTGEGLTLNMELEYFNTSSSKCILDVFKKLENISKQGKSVAVKWHYEEDDEDMLEAGEDYDAIIDINFEMVKVEEI
jgi:hypothetical protein